MNHSIKAIVILMTLASLICSPASIGGEVDPENIKQVISSYNSTGLKLYRHLKDQPGNIVISPYSIGSAMAMALSGARGETEEEMAGVLGISLGNQLLGETNAKILEKQARYNDEQKALLSVANALCMTNSEKFPVRTSYQQFLRDLYQAEIFDTRDVDVINRWIEEKTYGRIPGTIEELDPDLVCIILNAVYFKGKWDKEFKEDLTQPEAFWLTKDESLEVPMMRITLKRSVVEGDGFRAMSLPYKNRALAMYFILPDEVDGLADVEQKLTDKTLQDMFAKFSQLEPRRVAIRLPKFKFDYSAGLVPGFQSLGMNRAFSAVLADFNGIIDSDEEEGRLYIGRIQHKAFVEVDETGTEAAAATEMFLYMGGIPQPQPDPIRFVIDRPFIFMIVDRTNKAILFLGRVTNPLQ